MSARTKTCKSSHSAAANFSVSSGSRLARNRSVAASGAFEQDDRAITKYHCDPATWDGKREGSRGDRAIALEECAYRGARRAKTRGPEWFGCPVPASPPLGARPCRQVRRMDACSSVCRGGPCRRSSALSPPNSYRHKNGPWACRQTRASTQGKQQDQHCCSNHGILTELGVEPVGDTKTPDPRHGIDPGQYAPLPHPRRRQAAWRPPRGAA